MSDKPIRPCDVCQGPLGARQTRFCSQTCREERHKPRGYFPDPEKIRAEKVNEYLKRAWR